MNRGRLFSRQRRYAEAIADFSADIALHPNDSENYIDRGVAFSATLDFGHALADYTRAILLNAVFWSGPQASSQVGLAVLSDMPNLFGGRNGACVRVRLLVDHVKKP